MPDTLQQIQARPEQAIALRDDAAMVVQDYANDFTGSISQEMRARHVANGKAAENDLCILSGFDALEGRIATETPPVHCDAHLAPREAPRNEASGAPLPASGDVF